MARRLIRCTLLLLLVSLVSSVVHADYEESRLSLLPDVLPPINGASALERARAQALADFLRTHTRQGVSGCDIGQDLCLPSFSLDAPVAALPARAAPVFAHPVEGAILQAYATAGEAQTPQTYIAAQGALIFAPYSGDVVLVETLSGRRTRLTMQHGLGQTGAWASVLIGQFDVSVDTGDKVHRGEPIGRARPLRDATTRLEFYLFDGQNAQDPGPWLPVR